MDPPDAGTPQLTLALMATIREHGDRRIPRPQPLDSAMADQERDSDSLDRAYQLTLAMLDADTLAFIDYTIAQVIRRYQTRRPLTPVESRSMAEHPQNENQKP